VVDSAYLLNYGKQVRVAVRAGFPFFAHDAYDVNRQRGTMKREYPSDPAEPEPQPIVDRADPLVELTACRTRAAVDRWLRRLRDEQSEFSRRGRGEEWSNLEAAAKKLRKELP
jgi:hypothetical protein